MSSHSPKSVNRHPNPTTFRREPFKVAHITFEICDHPENGCTFALIAGDALQARDRKPLFTGFVLKGMGSQLRRLAARCDEVEFKGRALDMLE